jgi:FixJ family two-component response regulator
MMGSSNAAVHDRHVYVIDDDAAVRNALARSLERLGYKVHPFAGAASFLDGTLFCRPAVMLMDMRMPGINGIELQVHLATVGWESPVIFISGESTVTQNAIALEQGAFGFLKKPFGLDELASAVAAAMAEDALRLQIKARRDD